MGAEGIRGDGAEQIARHHGSKAVYGAAEVRLYEVNNAISTHKGKRITMATIQRRKGKLAKLAQVLCTQIDYSTAKSVDSLYPGFSDAYAAAQDEWAEDERNSHYQLKRHKGYSKVDSTTPKG